MFTVLFAAAVPVRVSVLWLVMPSPTTPVSGENEIGDGAAGAAGADGMVTASAADARLVLPAASVALAVKLWPPPARGPVVKLHAPLLLAVAVPTGAVPSNTCSVLF